MTLCCKDIRIRKFEFVTNTQLFCHSKKGLNYQTYLHCIEIIADFCKKGLAEGRVEVPKKEIVKI